MTTEQMNGRSEPSQAILRYNEPAGAWNEALPVGNGRLGAMMYGRTSTELIQLNEDSVYYGGKQERAPKQASANLPRLRQLIRDGKHQLAEELVDFAFVPMPSCQRHYEPLATIKISSGSNDPAPSGYIRFLDLLNGAASVKYESQGIKWHRELISSYEHDVMLLRIRSSQSTKFTVRLSRLGEAEWDTNEFYDSMENTDSRLSMRFGSGSPNGVQSCCALAACCDTKSSIKTIGGTMVVEAKETYLVIAGRTNFRHDDPTFAAFSDIDMALQAGLLRVWEAHPDFQSRTMMSMRLMLYDEGSLQEARILTDKSTGSSIDNALISLYHEYGRYLLMSSSRTSKHEPSLSLPSNLQGIWNPSFSPPWGCRFTININTQMNYWPCHIWDLSVCSDSLFYLLLRMAERGKTTAAEIYGCKRQGAWCAHHSTDIWADTDPVDRWMPSVLWPLGGAWLCLHIWERYDFEGDTDFLGGEPFLHKMLPVMEGAVLFVLDFLTEDKNSKYLVPCPSLSPENSYRTFDDDGSHVNGTLCEGSTMDVEIIKALFRAYLAATAKCNPANAGLMMPLEEIEAALGRLPPLKIGQDGRLLEWQSPYDEVDPGHRHFSHLFPLYPGNSITPPGTPELAQACRKTLKHRLANGGAHTGWSRAWLICLYARLHDGEECLKHVRLMLSTSTLPNLFSSHPPMQIDGNFGACAGILEMLIQSHETEKYGSESTKRIVRLLPACPKAWMVSGGRMVGVKARGGFKLTFEWRDNAILAHSTMTSQGRESAVVVLPSGDELDIPCKSGQYKIVGTKKE